MLLYEERIDRQVKFTKNLTPEEMLRIALLHIDEAKRKRAHLVTFDDFKTITQFSTQYGENGCSYKVDGKLYHLDE